MFTDGTGQHRREDMATLKLVKIRQGTTPLLTAFVDGEAIQDATVYVTLGQNDKQLTKCNSDDDGSIVMTPIMEGLTQIGTQVDIQYSQAETLYLRPGFAKVQIGWAFEDGTADLTNIGRLRVPKALYKGVKRYGKHSS